MVSEDKKGYVLVDKMPLKKPGLYMGLLIMNRPESMNPMGWEDLRAQQRAVNELAADDRVRVIAITGKGKGFSVGGDLKTYVTLQRDPARFSKYLAEVLYFRDFIEDIGKPVIALINGYCVAGGLELALSCDFAYAAESARIGDGHINFGQMGGGGTLSKLPRRIGPQRARELLYTGRLLTAREALEWGIVNRVVPDDKLVDAGLEFANIVAQKSPLALAQMKQNLNKGWQMSERDATHLESVVCFYYVTTSFDANEGVSAFAEKREPRYEGR